MTQHDTDMSASITRVTVEDAAQILGVSVDAIRKRIERGTLRSERSGKTRYVLLEDADMTEHDSARTRHDSDMMGLVEELRAHNETLRRQLDAERDASSELRRIIAALTQRIPELPAPEAPHASAGEARDGDLTASEELGGRGATQFLRNQSSSVRGCISSSSGLSEEKKSLELAALRKHRTLRACDT